MHGDICGQPHSSLHEGGMVAPLRRFPSYALHGAASRVISEMKTSDMTCLPNVLSFPFYYFLIRGIFLINFFASTYMYIITVGLR